MKIESVMNKAVEVCTPDATLLQAAQTMADRDVGFLVVSESERGPVVGVITDRDICKAAIGSVPLGEALVSQAMTQTVVSCRKDDDLGAAHRVMRHERVRRVPVLDRKGTLCGVLSLSDLAHVAVEQDDDDACEEVVKTLTLIARTDRTLAAR